MTRIRDFGIIPGIMPITNVRQIARFAELSGAALPVSVTDRIAAVDLPPSGDVVLVVGPEGGISPEELAAFAEAGARTVRVGDHVLRTSTAGVVALAALLNR